MSGIADKRMFGWFFQTLGLLLALYIVVVCIQIMLHKPHERPVVLCYPIAKVARIAMVKIPKIVNPKDQVFYTKNALWIERKFATCVDMTAANIPFFEQPSMNFKHN